MSKSRRQFLTQTPLALLGAAVATYGQDQKPAELPPGAPPAFGTATPVGPEVSPATFAQAEKLVEVELTADELAQAAGNWRSAMAPVYELRVGPHKVALEATLAPATIWNPDLPGEKAGPARDEFIRSKFEPQPLPANDDDIAFATVSQLSLWIQMRQLTSERLTQIYLARLEKFNPKLRCVITLTRDLALQQARQADQEIAAGKYRGPLHGIPWGAKDLLDTAGIPTTYGAEPFRNRIPAKNAVVVQRLNDAGAVLVAKLSLGALALNDIWFGGQTMNPWLLEEGSSGSSAGPGAATAAGLVAFAIGSETGGSIVSPSMRCGVTGLRPTFGRVARTGAMTLCWSLDKLGPMARCVEDTMLVLNTISGPDPGDLSSVPSKLDFNANASVQGLRVGYFPAWMKEAPATDVDRAALEAVKKVGMVPVEVSIPDWPYDSLDLILFAEGVGRVRGTDAERRAQPAQDAGARRVAQHLPPVAISLGRRLRAGRPLPAQGGDGDGTRLLPGRPAAGAVAARRNADHHQLHRASVAHLARGLCRGVGGAQRLGARPGASAAEVLAAAPRAARRDADRTAV